MYTRSRQIQLGKETTPGTAATPTTIWRGAGVPADAREVVFPEEFVGVIAPIARSYTAKRAGSFEFEEVDATFEQLPYILAAGVANVTTGTADGTGAGKIYQYSLPITTPNTIQTYTLVGGDATAAERLVYAFVEEFTLSGNAGEAWKMSARWSGCGPETAAFTTGLTIPTVEEILFSQTKLYIDPESGAVGTTEVSNTLIAAELSVTTGWKPVWTAGSLDFSLIKNVGPEATLKLTFEHNSSAVTEKSAWRSNSVRLIRLESTGSNLTPPGTQFQKKTLRIDLAGIWETFDAIDDQDGNDVISGTLRVLYSPTAALFCTITVVNTLANLP